MSAPLEETLPCGCRLANVDDAFVLTTCSPDCRWVAYVVDEAKRQGKPFIVADPW